MDTIMNILMIAFVVIAAGILIVESIILISMDLEEYRENKRLKELEKKEEENEADKSQEGD